MTIDNLEQALRLNNAYLKTHISALVTSINTEIGTLNTNSNTLKTKINDIVTSINNLSTNTQTTIGDVSDDFINKLNKLRDDLNNLSDSLDSLADDFTDHKKDTVIHVTQDDKDLWNATLKNAKDYAKELFDKIHSFEIIKCQELPTENINDHAVYFLQISPEEHDLFEEYMYINGEWELIGNTRIDLSNYVTKSMLQSAVDILNQLIITKENLLNKNLNNLETKHDKDLNNLNKNINKSLSDLETKHNKDISDILKNITNVSQNLTGQGTEFEEAIDGLNKRIDEVTHLLSKSIIDIVDHIEDIIQEKENKIKDLISELEENYDQDIQNINNDLENNYKPYLHEHENKDVLDKLNEDNNKHLLYNQELVGDYFTEEDLDNLIDFLWRIPDDFITFDNKNIITKDNLIFKVKKGGSV